MEDRKTFHIRAPMPRKGGNQFYLDKAPRVAKTLCGLPTTSHDIRFRWQSDSIGRFDCCAECIAIRKESRR